MVASQAGGDQRSSRSTENELEALPREGRHGNQLPSTVPVVVETRLAHELEVRVDSQVLPERRLSKIPDFARARPHSPLARVRGYVTARPIAQTRGTFGVSTFSRLKM